MPLGPRLVFKTILSYFARCDDYVKIAEYVLEMKDIQQWSGIQQITVLCVTWIAVLSEPVPVKYEHFPINGTNESKSTVYLDHIFNSGWNRGYLTP